MPQTSTSCSIPNTNFGADHRDERKWECERCGAAFTRKGNLARHMLRKNACARGPAAAAAEVTCDDCGKAYKRQWTYDRHLREGRCSAMKTRAVDVEMKTLELRMAELRASRPVIGVQNNTVNNTTQIQINNVIQIRDFGDENLSYVTQEWYKQLFGQIPINLDEQSAAQALGRKALEGIWANRNHPENWNVVLNSTRGDPLIVKDGRWTAAPMQEISSRMQRQLTTITSRQQVYSCKSDEGVKKELLQGEATDVHIPSARTTMQNVRAGLEQINGRTPKIGEDAHIRISSQRETLRISAGEAGEAGEKTLLRPP